jgi:hypothetical protein
MLHFLYRCYMFIYMRGITFGMSGTVSEAICLAFIHGGLVLIDSSILSEHVRVFYIRTLLIGVYLSWYHYLAGEVPPPYQRIPIVFMFHVMSDLYTSKNHTPVDHFGATLLLTGFIQSVRWQDVAILVLVPVHTEMFSRSLRLHGPTATVLHSILWRVTMLLPFVLMSYEDDFACIMLSVMHVNMPGSKYLIWGLAHVFRYV